MARLAKAARDMQAGYDVVVIGSGYGGGVAAARLARVGASVCVLERGREFLPGEFPDSLLQANREFQLSRKGKRLGSPTALFDMRWGDDVHVVSGCGLGGTSLINANVCLTPHEKVFEDLIWPSQLRYDHWLNYGYSRARLMLRPCQLPEEETPPKLAALETAAQKTGHQMQRVPLHIAFETGENAAGVVQRACTQCGDCMSGCNVGAKTTVHSTYLSEAHRFGAELFTEVSARFVEKLDGSCPAAEAEGYRWRVVFERLDGDRSIVGRRSVMAHKVVIAAGTLGSTEIMMRSRERGFCAGVVQRACTQCGDCMSGCNVGAKTTVHSTYLSEAHRFGAELFTEVSARFVEKLDGSCPAAEAEGYRWRVVFERLDGDRSIVGRRSVMAHKVVIAAGTLGSTEIMMRSRERGLKVSAALGQRFCTNADAIAMGYNNDILINGVGTGRQERRKAPKVGPGVSGMIDLRQGRDLEQQLVIVEAAIQSAMAPLLPMLFAAGGAIGEDMDSGLRDKIDEIARTAQSMILGAYTGAVSQTQTFLAVGHDDHSGEIVFEDDQVSIRWPDAAKQAVFKRIEEALRPVVAATGGTYVPNPVSSRWLGGNLLTVHPLGGCVMGDHAGVGVVDHRCRVFNGEAALNGTGGGADAVHEGLYICDGSVIPRPLGVHPLFTITAVAERAMALLMREKGWTAGLHSGLVQQHGASVLHSGEGRAS